VIAWIKKAAQLPALSETLLSPDAKNGEMTVLELDELWSFVLKKTNQAWIWIALCRKTRQVVAYAVGDRSEKTCRRLWEAIPHAYRTGLCYTDFWSAYQAVIPEGQHMAVGKETGETARAGALE
jgi:insertion element IS1 protein InsB